MAAARSWLLVLVFLMLPAAAKAAFPDKGNAATATVRKMTTVDGVRDYLVQPIAGTGPFPIVILLHGGTQDARQIWRQTSLPTLGRSEGFIVAAPDGIDRHWNDGRGSTIAGDAPSSADDVGFISSVIAEVIARDHGDPAAVFITGPSNGGFMTMHFACMAGHLLHAGANMISDLPADQAAGCKPGKALPWLSLNGTADPIVPFEGQPAGTTKRGQVQPALYSAAETFAFFADKAGCPRTETSERLPDLDRRDGSWVELRRRAPCAGGDQSLFYIVHDGGHITPGLRVGPLIGRIVGGANQDIDTGSVLWAFFRSTLH